MKKTLCVVALCAACVVGTAVVMESLHRQQPVIQTPAPQPQVAAKKPWPADAWRAVCSNFGNYTAVSCGFTDETSRVEVYEQGENIGTIPLGKGKLGTVAFQPTRKNPPLLALNSDDDVLFWDTKTRKQHTRFEHGKYGRRLSWSDDGDFVALYSGLHIEVWHYNGNLFLYRTTVTTQDAIHQVQFLNYGKAWFWTYTGQGRPTEIRF